MPKNVLASVVFALLICLVGCDDFGKDKAGEKQKSEELLVLVADGFVRYRENFGAFPPRVVEKDSGECLHSWRILVLPFIQATKFYGGYDLCKKWDDPRNSRRPECLVLTDDLKLETAADVARELYQVSERLDQNARLETDIFIVYPATETTVSGNDFHRSRCIKEQSVRCNKEGIETTVFVVVQGLKKDWLEPFDIPQEGLEELLTIDNGPDAIKVLGVLLLDVKNQKKVFLGKSAIEFLRERSDKSKG